MIRKPESEGSSIRSWEDEAMATDDRLAWLKLATGRTPRRGLLVGARRGWLGIKKMKLLREHNDYEEQSKRYTQNRPNGQRGMVGSILRVCMFLLRAAMANAMPKSRTPSQESPMKHGGSSTWTNKIGRKSIEKTNIRHFSQDQSLQPFGDYVGDISREDEEEDADPSLEFSEEFEVEEANLPRDTGWFNELTHHWIGHPDPLQNLIVAGQSLGEVRVVIINTGGHVRPFDDHRKYIYDNRLAEMCRIITNGVADIVISVESHLNEEGARMCGSYVKSFTNCEIECAVPSALAARMTVGDTPEDAGIVSDEEEDDTKAPCDTEKVKRKHVGPAGIVMVMSPEMKARMRGRPKIAATGRLVHITLGDGATEKEDKHPLHIVAVYGVSAVRKTDKHRVAMAKTLQVSLRKTLEPLRYQRVMVCGDINSVASTTDRENGQLTSYDTQDWASPLWEVLQDTGLIDVMARVNVGEPPMTYCPNGNPCSRIDVIYASEDLVRNCGMRAATGARAGTLSKTHRPLAISFSALGFEAIKRSSPVSKVAVFKTCVRTSRWQPSKNRLLQ